MLCSVHHLISNQCLDEFNYLAVKQSYAAYALSEILVRYIHEKLINVEEGVYVSVGIYMTISDDRAIFD